MRKVKILQGSYKDRVGYFHGYFQIGNLEHGCDPVAVVEFDDGRCDEFSSSYICFENPPKSEEVEQSTSHNKQSVKLCQSCGEEMTPSEYSCDNGHYEPVY